MAVHTCILITYWLVTFLVKRMHGKGIPQLLYIHFRLVVMKIGEITEPTNPIQCIPHDMT